MFKAINLDLRAPGIRRNMVAPDDASAIQQSTRN
jgi:hypothetical protein